MGLLWWISIFGKAYFVSISRVSTTKMAIDLCNSLAGCQPIEKCKTLELLSQKCTQCSKITENVSFEFSSKNIILIFVPKWTKLHFIQKLTSLCLLWYDYMRFFELILNTVFVVCLYFESFCKLLFCHAKLEKTMIYFWLEIYQKCPVWILFFPISEFPCQNWKIAPLNAYVDFFFFRMCLKITPDIFHAPNNYSCIFSNTWDILIGLCPHTVM